MHVEKTVPTTPNLKGKRGLLRISGGTKEKVGVGSRKEGKVREDRESERVNLRAGGRSETKAKVKVAAGCVNIFYFLQCDVLSYMLSFYFN